MIRKAIKRMYLRPLRVVPRSTPKINFFIRSLYLICNGKLKASNTNKTIFARPESILLRSGDILIMTEAARNSYHAVPRILDQSLIDKSRRKSLGLPTELVSSCQTITKEEQFCLDYLSNHRININTRQVFWILSCGSNFFCDVLVVPFGIMANIWKGNWVYEFYRKMWFILVRTK